LLTALTLVTVVQEKSERDDVLALAVAEAETWHYGIETVTRAGDAPTQLAEAARERHAPLLVLGSRGRGPLRAELLGSVSAAATRFAPCPVVIVSPEAVADIRS
jgi:nucleotide-binding universal stress UspA family protein